MKTKIAILTGLCLGQTLLATCVYGTGYDKLNPTAVFTATTECQGESTLFENNSTTLSGSIVANIWDFGDGQGSTVLNPEHIYSNPGTFSVSLTVINTNGDVDTFSDFVTVHPSGTLNFIISSETKCAGSIYNFTNLSSLVSGSFTSYLWDFGDGVNTSDGSPSHTFDQPGTYAVTLSTTTDNSCTNSLTQYVDVFPQAQVDFTTNSSCLGQTLQFINNTRTSANKADYLWDFGDGTTSLQFNPQHLYTGSGDFPVTLTVTTDGGCVVDSTINITIFPIPNPEFTAEPVCDAEDVVFENLSSITEGEIVANTWDFGDQTNAIVAEPVKEYLNPGTYEVKLITESDKGCIAEISREITVKQLPIANFSVEDVCIGKVVEPVNLSQSELAYSWDFGDGTEAEAQSPDHQYSQPGLYNISLMVTADNGCRDSISHPAIVYNLPAIKAGSDANISQGYSVQLEASGGKTYFWLPAETLNNSQVQAPRAAPLKTTEYIVYGQDGFGCESSDTVVVYVEKDYSLVAANVLTPDGNGKNDTWIVENIETFGDAYVRIYDGWGKLIYEKINYQNDWSGTSEGDVLPDGTYYYYITFSSSKKEYNGALTVLRNKQ